MKEEDEIGIQTGPKELLAMLCLAGASLGLIVLIGWVIWELVVYLISII